MTRRRRIGLTVTILVGVVALYEGVTSIVAYTADAYVQSDLVALAPQITGRIVGVQVSDNQSVAEGDLLVTIDPVPFQLSVDQRQAEMTEAHAHLEADRAAASAARDALAAATAAAIYAHDTQARAASLADVQAGSRAELDQANDALSRADAAVNGAKAAIAQAQFTTAVHQAAQVRAAEALVFAEWQRGQTRLLAPASGTIANLTVRVGDTAVADVPLIGIVDAHAWRIVANYRQSYLRTIAPGNTAWVWLNYEPWRLHRARVAGVSPGIARNQAPGGLLAYVAPTTDWVRLERRFPVTLTLVDPPADLKLYMGADARVVMVP